MSSPRVLAAVAGSSGGHIIPALVAMKAKKESRVIFFTTTSSFDRSILNAFPAHYFFYRLPISPLPGKKVWRYPLFFFQLFRSIIISIQVLQKERPEEVMSMGGLVSLPVCWAARLLKIRVALFELNAVPGKAIRWLAPYAQTIYVCFAEAAQHFPSKKVVQAEYPLRFSALEYSPEKVRAHLDSDPSKKVLLLLGGSQGSLFLNRLLINLVRTYPLFMGNIHIIHQVGAAPWQGQESVLWFTQLYKDHQISATVFSFTAHLEQYYSAADIIISRAGAGTLFEILHFKKPAFLVPLEEHAEGHQLENARAMIKKFPEYFTLMRQQDIKTSVDALYRSLDKLFMLPAE